MGSGAAWRTAPLGHVDVLARIHAQGDRINPLLQLPWIKAKCFRPDWLHVADLGVAADFIGNAMQVLQQICPGNSIANRVGYLSDWMQHWYERHGTEDRLNVLLPQLFAQPRKGYKLRAQAAKVRALVPFVDHVCQLILSPMHPVQGAVRAAARCLAQVYSVLSEDAVDEVVAREASTRFALLFLPLHDSQHAADDRA